MSEEYLQAAFEIKAACDDISRKLLRWHWEEKPGAHSVDALLKHLAQRQKESPDYYERLPELNGRTGWQQLDTTLCMRILLAAAPTAPLCFRHWRRSSPLLPKGEAFRES